MWCCFGRYFADLSHSAVIVKTILGITHAGSRMASIVSKCIEAWRSYSHFWKLDALSFVADLLVLDFPPYDHHTRVLAATILDFEYTH